MEDVVPCGLLRMRPAGFWGSVECGPDSFSRGEACGLLDGRRVRFHLPRVACRPRRQAARLCRSSRRIPVRWKPGFPPRRMHPRCRHTRPMANWAISSLITEY